MKRKIKLWLALGALVASLSIVLIGALDRIGIAPNLGFPFGYYGKFNRTLARVEANPALEVVRTTLHQDTQLEDFYITVRAQDGREIRLQFEDAHSRPLSDLLQEFQKVGM